MHGGQLNSGKRLLMAAIGAVTSIAVLGAASYAWFTLSTNPEIKGMEFSVASDEGLWISKDGQEFFKHVDISSEMAAGMNVLRPVSTIDGLHWYVCDYNVSTGNIVEDQFFLKEWCTSETHDEEEHTHCDNGGFYAYTDVWVKTNKDTANVRLAIPNLDERYEEETTSGCFVLSYDVAEDEDGNQSIKIMQKGPETCARVGMMVFDPTTEENPVVVDKTEDPLSKAEDLGLSSGNESNPKFFIYEPNADMRSQLDKQSDRYLTDIYVSKLNIKDFTSAGGQAFRYSESDGKYLQTYPIKHKAALEENEAVTDERGTLESAAPAMFPAGNLIVQRAATWNLETIEEDGINSAPIDLMNTLMQNRYINRGRFVTTENIQNALYMNKTAMSDITKNNDFSPVLLDGNNAGSATSHVLFDLKKGEVRQIRLYFWIEGQDVDCWNDVAGMNFLARIEFATE